MNLKRFTSFALALILCFALAPVNADALASENDAVKNGYYDSSGQWVEGKLQQTLPEGIHSVNKTATPVADNTYEVTLEVVTKQKVESFTKKSATVLVLDTSKSMNDDSRLKTLKNSAAEFITTYAGKKENTGRYLAVVQFSTGTKVVLNWTDVSTEQGKKSAIDSIQALKANEGTNLQAGLKQASSLFKQSTVQEIQKENRNTVVLTDGAPTYYLEKCSGGIFTWTHTHVVIDGVIYDEKGSGSSGSQNIIDLTTKDAKVLKDESKVYTVCYGAQNQTTYKGGPLVSDFLADNIAQSSDTAFIAGKTEDLMKVFEAISESVVSGITGENLTVIKNVLAMKSEYFIHEDYGMFGYEEQYIYGDISVNASKDSSMGVLLELRGMGCRNLEYVLQARGIDWYYFLSSCIDYQGVFKRIDLAVNDMGGLLDIEILRERYYANKVWKRSRTHEAVDSGKLSGTHGDTAKTFYIGSKNSSIYFCLYEKEKEQKSKGIKTDIKNRFEIRLKSGKAEQTIEQLVFSRNPEQIIANLILTQIDFPVYILWDIFLDNVTTSLPFIMTPVAVNMDKTKRWLERQVMPSLLMIKEIEKQTGANYLEEIDRHTRLTEKQELKIKQMTTDIADMIEKDTAVPQGNDGIF